MYESDPLSRVLRMADRAASQSTPLRDPVALASVSVTRARRQLQRRRWLVGMSLFAAIVGAATELMVPRASRPRPDGAPDLAALRAEVTALTARGDQLAFEIKAHSAFHAEIAPRRVDAVAPQTIEMRERAAFVLVLLADRTAAAGGDADTVAAGYRRAAENFPDSRSGAIARQRLHAP